MNAAKQLFFAMCLFWGLNTLAHAESRGEMLYETHCSACHTEQIHWRKKRLATDWQSLKEQVRRWQATASLVWNEQDISDVAHYLNTAYYGFPVTGQKVLSQDRATEPLTIQNK